MAQSTDGSAQAHEDLLALLAWYQAVGVDCALGCEPVAWLGSEVRVPGGRFDWPQLTEAGPGAALQSQAMPRAAGGAAPVPRTDAPDQRMPVPLREGRSPPSARGGDHMRTPPARFATGPADAAETSARTLAARVGDLAALQSALEGFEGCALKTTAKSTCVYRGAAKASVMIIGEAPGRDEDLEGRPFVGRAGLLLDRMLEAIDLDETKVHITNVVYWRPPGNRTPTPQETQICRPFLMRQMELVEPDVVMLLGGAAAKTVFDTADGIMKVRGKWREIEIGSRKVRALATLHPAYLLRTAAAKRIVWRDLLALKSFLQKKQV
jgi:uracil-DNA glycosylase